MLQLADIVRVKDARLKLVHSDQTGSDSARTVIDDQRVGKIAVIAHLVFNTERDGQRLGLNLCGTPTARRK